MNELHNKLSAFLRPYLSTPALPKKPLTVLTWAQSLDAKITSAPRTRFALSSLETKYMTHLIRQQSDTILIGAETAVVDDPGLMGRTTCEERC
jgi:2,5-diamino-6-(ribosylamino)-4(3H)-pyrimidinone 5'-phosphate reductase